MQKVVLPLLILLFFSPYFFSCQSMDDYQSEKFRLSASACAADGYPVELYRGNFIRSDGKSFPVPSGTFLEGSWGLSGSVAVLGDAQQPAPDSLEVLWFSYPEDKFYEGHFRLPQQQIHALLKEGYWNPAEKKPNTYYQLTVCLLPKGAVVVWLTGSNRVLVGRFQASETVFDFKQFNGGATRAEIVQDERSRMSPEVQQQIAAGKLSSQKWDDYLRKYPWKLAFNQKLKLYNYGISYLSAEGTDFPATPDMALYAKVLLEPLPKAVPKDWNLFVETEAGHRHEIRVEAFDEAQTIAAFQTLHQGSPKSSITLFVEADKPFRQAKLVLQNEFRQIPLDKTKVQLFDED